MGVTQAAGLSLRWLRDLLKNSGNLSYDELTHEAAAVPAGSDGVLWAPYLMGERTPHLDPNARGTLTGLAANHTRGHVVRAVLEGVAFSLKDTFSLFAEMRVPVGNVRLGGGGARSSLWRQIQADVYGCEVEILAAEEGAAYGAALLAGVGAKFWSSVEQACDAVVKVQTRVQPNDASSSTVCRCSRELPPVVSRYETAVHAHGLAVGLKRHESCAVAECCVATSPVIVNSWPKFPAMACSSIWTEFWSTRLPR
jgi:xylulokinase